MLEEILSLNIFVFLLVFARMGTAFFLFPGYGSTKVIMRGRLFFALAVSFVLTPILLDRLPAMPDSPIELFLLIGGEVLAGAIIGSTVKILFASVQVAGTVTSFVSGMANALAYDPISEQQSAVVAGFLSTIATLLLFVTNLHHVLIEAMVNSYELFKPGVAPMPGDILQMVARHVAQTFKVGIQMASPFIVVSMAYYMGLGVMTRLAPQIPIFFVAMPLQIVVSFVVLMIVVPSIMMVFLSHTQEGLQFFLVP
ncbi:MAG: flagellar biosynthetic protein FliR [Rhodospirillaceae bacterium]|jgi:flagellar biosynthetic protein FliR|nr:flagellar biosynthetic protein FliR [Rhodospirillaceae bacterium]